MSGPPIFEPVAMSKMSRCAECGGDVSGDMLTRVRGYVVHRWTCEDQLRERMNGEHRDIPDPPAFIYPDE